MKIGVVFPQTEAATDPTAIRDYVQSVESMGFHHLLAFDHVLGANAEGNSGSYNHLHSFLEPFVLFGNIAAVTQRIELVTGVIILPQRQTALVAKQAATLDVLSNGRLRLGIGIGWNKVEYQALGENFGDRGIRSEEQIEVLKALWTNDLVTFNGRWHTIIDAGLNPLPVQQPIPIWFGGSSDQVLRRIARMGDGWFPNMQPDESTGEQIEKMRGYAQLEGRDPDEIGIESWITPSDSPAEEWVSDISKWRQLGATHLSVNTMGAGLAFPCEHINALRTFKEAIG